MATTQRQDKSLSLSREDDIEAGSFLSQPHGRDPTGLSSSHQTAFNETVAVACEHSLCVGNELSGIRRWAHIRAYRHASHIHSWHLIDKI
jgi:hypothetical protein